MNLFKIIGQEVSDAFEKCGYDGDLGAVTISNRPDLCEFQCNGAMVGAKRYKKSPLSIANEVNEVLKSVEIFSEVVVVPPGFINISVKNTFLENIINENNCFDKLITRDGIGKVIIDYGGPNVAKPLHVGHMRTAIIGESIKRISRFLGYDTIGDVHLGDWGLQMGLIITEIQDRYPDINYFKADYEPSPADVCPVTIEQLNEIYPFASKKSKEDTEYKARAYDATSKLQTKQKGYYDLWKHIVKISILDMKKLYSVLNVEFDLWNGESDANDYIDELLEVLNNKKLSYESQGALIVDVTQEDDKAEVPPIIIIKSDGSQLYSTSDLATIISRQELYEPTQILYVVDNRQSLHFTQVFRCTRLSKLVPDETKLEFIGFGTMNGTDGKPYKTREGGIMKLEDLISTMKQKALAKVNENIDNNVDINESEKDEIASKVGIAALKFGDLYNHRTRDYIFDMDRFVEFSGKTGPYLLYTVARINSILKKVNEQNTSNIKIYSKTEKQLILKTIMTDDVLQRSFSDKAPNYVCEHVYEISSLFSKFYDENKIITEEDQNKKSSWVQLLKITKDTITSLLDLLAIDTVPRM